MTDRLTDPLPTRAERLTRHWWFYLILLIFFFFPSYSVLPLNPVKTPELIIEVLSKPVAYSVPSLFPIFKLIPLLLIIWLISRPNVLNSRLFYAWAGINLLVVAVFQNMAVTPTYGFAVLVGNVIVMGLAGLLWIFAAFKPRGSHLNLSQKLPGWRYWVILPALLAFWFPAGTASGVPVPDFAPLGFIANEAGLTFCMMMPFYLAVLTIAYPNVDLIIMRISAFIGLVTGLLNVMIFFLTPEYGPWMGVLHLPLLLISIYAFVFSLRKSFS